VNHPPSLICPQCQAHNPAEAKFCNACGAPLSHNVNTHNTPLTTSAEPTPPQDLATWLADEVPSSPSPSMPLADSHAVVAIEWLNWKNLSAQTQQRCHDVVAQKGLVFGATLDRHTHGFSFVRIAHASTPVTAADTAVQLALALRRAMLQQQTDAVDIKLGIDFDPVATSDPLCAVTQRMNAPVNGLLVSAAVAGLLSTPYQQSPMVHGVLLGDVALTPNPNPLPPAAQAPLATTKASAPVADSDEPVADTTTAFETPEYPPTQADTTAAQAQAAQPAEAASSQTAQSQAADQVLAHVADHALPVYWQPAQSLPKSTQAVPQVAQQCLTLLQQFLDNPTAGPRLLVLQGHEGGGKTRLIQTLLRQLNSPTTPEGDALPENGPALAPRCFWLHGESGPVFEPLALWHSVFCRFYTMAPMGQPLQAMYDHITAQQLDPPELNDVWQGLMSMWFRWQPLTPLDATHRIETGALAHVVVQLFQRLCEEHPVVLLLDDLEEADPASIELLLDLLNMGMCQHLPVCVVVTHQADMMPLGPLATALQQGVGLYLPLYQTTEELTRFLQEGPLKTVWDQFPPHLIESVVAPISQGNPLVVEECLRLLFLKGALNPLTGPSLTLQANSIEDVFAERFGLLSPQAQHAAQWMAVLGRPLAVPVLAHLLQTQPDDADLTESLANLVEHGIIQQDAQQTLTFRHRLMLQWVYLTLDEEARTHRHTVLGQQLDALTEAGHYVPFTLIAEQSELAGDNELAAHAWGAVGAWAGHLHSLAGFNMGMLRAATLYDALRPSNPAVEEPYQIVTQYLGQMNAVAQPMVTQTLQDQQEPTTDAQALQQLLTRCTTNEATGQFAQGINTINATLQKLEGMPNVEGETLYLKSQLAKFQVLLGRLPEADTYLRQQVIPLLGTPALTEHPLHMLAWLDTYTAKLGVQLMQGKPELFDTLDLMTSHPYLQTPPINWLLTLAQVHRMQGRFAQAQQQLEAIHPTEPADWQAWHNEQLALYNDLCQWDKALGVVQLARTKATPSVWHKVQLQLGQATALNGLGQFAQALPIIQQAIADSMDQQYQLHLLHGQWLLGKTLLHTKQLPAATNQLQQVLAHPQLPAYYGYLAKAQLAAALRRQGQVAQAGALLEGAWQTVTDTRQLPLVAELAQQVGLFYGALAKQGVHARVHTEKGLQFLQRAKRMWQQMDNPARAQQLAQYLNPAASAPKGL
jgi:tetratricopeptide (TPR) repeat protein